MQYRRCGRSGLKLPAVSLGLWHNFGHDRPVRDAARRSSAAPSISASPTSTWPTTTARRYGSAEKNFGRMLADDLKPYRDELVISTKAGYDMWPGPYGEWGSRKYLLASLDQSLAQDGPGLRRHLLLPSVRPGHAAGGDDGRAGRRRALRARRCTSASRRTTRSGPAQAAAILRELGTPLLIPQPSYSMINRWIEHDRLLDTLEQVGAGCIAFSPLAQGLLTDRYLNGVPADSRVAHRRRSMGRDMLTEDRLARVRGLNEVAERRGQTLAQLALAWALRDPRMTSLVIGASSVAPARGQRRRARPPRLHRRRVGRDRPARHRRRRQPLVPLQLCVAPNAAPERRCRLPRSPRRTKPLCCQGVFVGALKQRRGAWA